MKKIVFTLATTALLSSCGIYSSYERPADIKTDGLYGATVTESADSAGLAALPWRSLFTDPTLQSLIEKGLQNNTDMRTAALGIEQAEASLKAAKLSFFPSFALAPQGGFNSVDWAKASKTYTIPLSASWQVDIFGSLRNAKKRAQVQLESSKAYKQAVQTQLIATIANYYYTLAMLDEQLNVSKATADIWKENIKTYKALMNVGQTTSAAVAQAEGNYYNVCAQIVDLEQQITEVENSFSTLLGETVSSIQRQSINDWQAPQSITVGIPSYALANRPDVKNAELALASAFYSTNAARSAFYPALNLTGTLGWTNDLGVIVNPGKWIWQAVGSLTQPIFQNGKLRANLKISKAQQEEAQLAFQQTLLNAGAEVNTAMAKIQNNTEKEELNDKRIASMEQAVKSTQLLMQNSSTNYLEVLTAQQSLLSAQLSKISTQFAKIQGTIELYQALGGGAE
ncbi:TolC family protein [Bacteroides eggerthii]|uniref:TolC family protein n=1 Tax=Bacteroides eggerthii TaxID=28111 RepID=A0ABT7U5Q8_9BACE|nr:TolC family protein [Bacteroides eggerthii]